MTDGLAAPAYCRDGETPRLHRLVLRVALPVLLAIGVGIYAMDLTAEDFDGDEYAYALSADRDFSDYMLNTAMGTRPLLGWQFGLPFKLAGYVLGSEDSAAETFRKRIVLARIPSVLSGLALIGLAFWSSRRLWPQWPALTVLICSFLLFNLWTIPYHRWGMTIFSEYLLLSTGLYFLCCSLCTESVSKRQRVGIAVLSCVLPFVYFPTLPAFTIAVFSTWFVRWMHGSERTLKSAFREWSNLRHFALAIPAYAVAAFLEPWELGVRPSNAEFFFGHSGLAGSPAGVAEFVVNRSARLFGNLIQIKTGLSRTMDLGIGALSLALAALGVLRPIAHLLISLWRPSSTRYSRLLRMLEATRVGPEHSFTALYVALVTVAVLALALMNIYPYGLPRYALYLLSPLIVLVGYGSNEAALLFLPWMRRIRGRPARAGIKSESSALSSVALVIAFLLISCIGPYRVYVLHQDRMEVRLINDKLREQIVGSNDTMLLYGASTKRFFQALAPARLEDAIPMGYTLLNVKGGILSPDRILVERLSDSTPPLERLQIAYWGPGLPAKNHPQFVALLSEGGWHIESLFQQYDMMSVLGIATYTRTIGPAPEANSIGISILEVLQDGSLFLRGWINTTESIAEVQVSVNGSAITPVIYPKRKEDVYNVPREYRKHYCLFEIRVPSAHDLAGESVLVEVVSNGGSIARRTLSIPPPT